MVSQEEAGEKELRVHLETLFRGANLSDESPVPLIAQLFHVLTAAMVEGRLLVGATLPREVELSAYFGLSRSSVREVLKRLVREGWIRRTSGRGTEVNPARLLRPMGVLRIKDQADARRSLRTLVLSRGRTTAGALCARSLEFAAETLLSFSEAVHLLDGERLILEEIYRPVPARPAAGAKPEVNRASAQSEVYPPLRADACQVVEEDFEALTADRELAAKLGVGEGSAVIRCEQLRVEERSKLREFSILHYRGDRFRFQYRLRSV